jgi:hypothetical protein
MKAAKLFEMIIVKTDLIIHQAMILLLKYIRFIIICAAMITFKYSTHPRSDYLFIKYKERTRAI